MMNPRCSITRSRFLDILDGLTAAVQLDVFKIDHYCRGFECKMRKVGLILIKLSSDEDYNYYGCFGCELESGYQFECYLDFCLLLNVELNICTKFVLQYMSLQVFQDAQ